LNQIRISDEIKNSLENYEPRIAGISVSVSIYPDSNELNCTVQYDIIGLSVPPQEVNVLLHPARV